MQYKRMGKNRVYRLNVPQLSGGLNVSTDPTLIEDNELSDVQNLYWKDGALRTRPAMTSAMTEPLTALPIGDAALSYRFDSIASHPIEVDGQLCTVVISAACYGSSTNRDKSYHSVQVVSLDGALLHTYTLNSWHVMDMVIAPCDAHRYGCAFLLYRGNTVYKPDNTSGTMVAVPEDELYAPLLMVNGKSVGVTAADTDPGKAIDGVMFEGFNILTRRYRAQFTTENGVYEERFYLPTALKSGSLVTVEAVTPYGTVSASVVCGGTAELEASDGEKTVTHTLKADAASGLVSITPPLPKSVVSDNLTITAYAADTTDGTTGGATIATWFGGTQNKLGGTRLFLAGFAEDKAKVMWSDVSNPLYFPENNYMFVGDQSQRVTALEKQDEMLVIFKERELFSTTYVEGSIDEEAVAGGTNIDVTVSQAYFPLTQLSPYIGCDCPHTIAMCQNRLVWLCADARVYMLATAGQYSERNVREIGGKIRGRLLGHTEAWRKAASAMDYDGKYWLLIEKTAYMFDYGEAGFLYVAAYYYGEKRAKNIAWFVHPFDGFPSQAVQRLVSDGAHRAIAISTHDLSDAYTHVRVLYKLTEDTEDHYARVGVTDSGKCQMTATDQPIVSRLTTKAYDFGDIASFKRVGALFLAASAADASLSFEADGQPTTARMRYHSDTMDTHLVMPNVKRCKTLTVTCESEQPLCVRGMRLQYTVFGNVR